MANRRIETKSSRTAAYNCFSRGCATREKNPRFRGSDYFAELMFPPLAKLALNLPPLRKYLMRKMFPPGIYEYVFARTKVMDTVFKEALDECVAQIVLLGAGFDTRAMRFASHNRGTKVFELDVATTQQAKVDMLHKRHIPLPDGLIFTPIDFDKQNIFEILSKAGYTTGQRSLFLWEGVTMYLTAQAVDDTLNFIHQSAASGSRVCFDYLYASVLRQENRYYGEKDIYKIVAGAGEGWTYGLEDGSIEPFMSQRGFELVAHFTPSDLERLYLTDEDGKLHGRVNGTHCIVIASVNG